MLPELHMPHRRHSRLLTAACWGNENVAYPHPPTLASRHETFTSPISTQRGTPAVSCRAIKLTPALLCDSPLQLWILESTAFVRKAKTEPQRTEKVPHSLVRGEHQGDATPRQRGSSTSQRLYWRFLVNFNSTFLESGNSQPLGWLEEQINFNMERDIRNASKSSQSLAVPFWADDVLGAWDELRP